MKSRVNQGITVKPIDVAKTKLEIKKCHPSVQRYVESLERLVEIQKNTLDKAIKKIKELLCQ